MLSLFSSSRIRGGAWALLGLSLLVFTACSSHPENSPVVRKKFKELSALQDQVGDLSVQMKQISAEISAMRKDVAEVKSLNGGGEAVARIEAISAKMEAFEQEMSQVREALNASAHTRQTAANSAVRASRETASASSSSNSSSSSQASSGSGSSASRERAAAPPKPTPKPKPRGKYYTIKAGDSPESIAKTHGVTLQTLLRANRLPKDATIFPGQSLYIPAATQ